MEQSFDIGAYLIEISQIVPSNLSNEQLTEIVEQVDAILYFLNEENQNTFSVFSAKKAYEYQNVRFKQELEKRNIKVVTLDDIEILIKTNPGIIYRELKKYDLISLLNLENAWEKIHGNSDVYKLILAAIHNEITSRSVALGILN